MSDPKAARYQQSGVDGQEKAKPSTAVRQQGDGNSRLLFLGLLVAGLFIIGVVKEWLSPSTVAAESDVSESASLSDVEAARQTLPLAKTPDLSGGMTPSADELGERLPKPVSVEAQLAQLTDLVEDRCDVRPARIITGVVAYTVELQLDSDAHACLDEIAVQFDRDHPTAPQLLFDVTAVAVERNVPVIHISTVHTGSLPYIHLRDGRTLFVGALVDGWQLSSIDDEGAEFRQGDRVFKLAINGTGGAL